MTELGFLDEDEEQVFYYDPNNEIFQKEFISRNLLKNFFVFDEFVKKKNSCTITFSKFEMAPMDKIFDYKGKIPSGFNEEKTSHNLKMIDKFNALKPVVLMLKGDTYIIEDGLNRWAAAKERGYSKIPALVGREVTGHFFEDQDFNMFDL